MNIEDISQKTIRGYLIGSLDEATVEHIDELSIASQELADRIAVEQYELIDDWVSDRMVPSERASFERALSRSPTLREKVEVSRLISAASPRAAAFARPVSAERLSLLDRLFGGFPRIAYGLAAAVVLLGIIALSIFVLRDRRGQEVAIDNTTPIDLPPVSNTIVPPSPEPSVAATPDAGVPNSVNAEPQPSRTPAGPAKAERQPRLPALLALTLTPPTRGSNEIRTLRIEPGVRYLDLNVQTEAEPDGKLRVEIGDASSGQVEWRSAAITPMSRNGRVSIKVRVPVQKLGSGLRSVRLRQTAGDGTVVDEHAIRIIR